MRVDLWSDIICPWCGLGNHRLDQALAKFAHADQVEVVHHSFQLDEAAPNEPQEVKQMLAEKYGASPRQVEAMTGRVEALAKADGLSPYHVGDNRVANTALAHAFAAWAAEQGKAREAWRLLYKTYFGEARSVFDVASLAALAPQLGLDAAEAKAALESGRYAEQVIADARTAQSLGSTGVPFFVIDRRYAIAGAQSVEVLLQALEVAWKESQQKAAQ